MIRLYQDRTIKMCQGDNGVIAVSLGNYKFTENDKFDLTVYDKNDNIVLEKEVSYFDEGLAYLDFVTHETINIKKGEYTYVFNVKLSETEEFQYLEGLNFVIE